MSKVTTKKEDIGLSPDALIFRGEKKVDNVSFELIEFNEKSFKITEPNKLSEIDISSNNTTWLNVVGIHDSRVMQEIADQFDIEPMVLSQVMETNTRPKAQDYDSCIYITMKMLQYNEGTESIEFENLSMIIKDDLLISFQEKDGDSFNPIRERIEKSKRKIRSSGVGYLTLALMDVVVDHYTYLIGLIGEEIELLEDELLDKPHRDTLETLNDFRKEMSLVRRIVHPCRELIITLIKMDSDLWNEDLEVFMRDLQQNINFANEASENYWVMLSDYMNLYHTVISSRLNDTMKYLTIFSVLFIPATFIVGVYGTNFKILPEVDWNYGYPTMWVVILISIGAQLYYFRKKNWL